MMNLTPETRRLLGAASAASGMVLGLGGWLFLQAGSGAAMFAAGLVCLLTALALDLSKLTIGMVVGAAAIWLSPFAVGFFYHLATTGNG